MSPIEGSLVALITPMDDQGAINFSDLDKLVDFHLENNTNGLVVLGTTGEAATIDDTEREAIIQQVVARVAGKIPVIIGTGHNDTKKALKLTQEAMQLGADAALVVTPYYNKPSQAGLIAHYKAIASNVDIPIILYNVPGRTACDMLPDTVAELINSDLKNIVGLKEAVGNQERINHLAKLCSDDFALLSGDDETYVNLLRAGGHGTISVTANIAPKIISEVCRLAKLGDWTECDLLNNKLRLLHKDLFVSANPMPIKWAMYHLGLISTPQCRLPLLPLESKYFETLKTALNHADMLK